MRAVRADFEFGLLGAPGINIPISYAVKIAPKQIEAISQNIQQKAQRDRKFETLFRGSASTLIRAEFDNARNQLYRI